MKAPWFPAAFDVDRHRLARLGHPDAVITALAEHQQGKVALRQLLALGVSWEHVRSRLRSRHLVRVSAGVYRVGHVTATATAAGRRTEALLGGGRGAVLGGLSAAAHRGAEVRDPWRVQMIIPPGRKVTLRTVDARAVRLADEDWEEVDGLPCLTWPRLLLDVAARADRRTLERLWHNAIYRRVLDADAVARALHEHFGEPGTVEVRRLWERRQGAIGAAANRLEAELREIVLEAGMPEPHVNEPLWINGVRLRPDVYVRERGLAMETDGRDAHEDPEQQLSDHERDALYRSAGITIERLGWWAVHYQRPAVLGDLQRYEAAWQRTGGVWTPADPAPRFRFARPSSARRAA